MMRAALAMALVGACARGDAPSTTPGVSNTLVQPVDAGPSCDRCMRLTSFVDLDGRTYVVPDGKHVVLSFFAVYIEGQLDVLDEVSQASQRYNGRAQFLSVAVSDLERADIVPYIQRRGSTLPVVLGTDAVMAALPEGAANAVPTTLVFDRYGVLVETFVGKDEHSRLTEALDRLMLAP